MYVHLYMYIYRYVHLCTCIYVSMYVCMYIKKPVESKRPPWKHFNSMRHDRHLMQRWLPIEQHLYACIYLFMYVCMFVCMYVCLYFAMYVLHTTSLSIMCLSTISPTRKFIAALSLSVYNRAIT